MTAFNDLNTYCCISRGRFPRGGWVVTCKWQIQVDSGWFTQRRKGRQAVRHVHVCHGEEYIICATHSCVEGGIKERDKEITPRYSDATLTSNFSERCSSLTSTRNSSSGVALKQIWVCSWHSCILLQASVQFQMEPIFILLLDRSALSILSPFLWSFTHRTRNTKHIQFLHNSYADMATLSGVSYLTSQQGVWGAHLHLKMLQTSPEGDGLVVGTAE